MKRVVFFFWLLMQTFSMNAKVKVTRVDPTNWYVGMKDPSLQLMFYGDDLDGVEVTTDYLGARVDSVVHLSLIHI